MAKKMQLFGGLIIIVLQLYLNPCDSAKVLGIFIIPSYSHQVVFQPIYRELSLRGHEVIAVTSNPLNDSTLTNLTEIDVSYLYEHIKDVAKSFPSDDFVQAWSYGVLFSQEMMKYILEDEYFKKVYQDPSQKFDLVIMEGYSHIMYALGYKFNAPVIAAFSLEASLEVSTVIGSPIHPALYGQPFLTFERSMSIWRKIYNTYCFLWTKWFDKYTVVPINDAMVKKYLGSDIPSVSTLQKYLSMIFVNSNPFLTNVKPVPPSVITLGFMHIKPPKPLPQELQEVLNNSTQGFVYFSLGSNAGFGDFPESTRNEVIQALSELPYTVLIKWNLDTFPNLGKNIIAKKWFPQQDILAHPNIKLFVTQGGQQSTEEAISRGVPLVGIPVLADQLPNIKMLVKHGVAVLVRPNELTFTSLSNAIKEVAENPKYRKKMQEIQRVAFDQPMTSVEKAVFWSEYVIRNKGAPYLRSFLADTPLYEYLMLDVLALLLSFLLIVVFIIYQLLRITKKMLTSPGSKMKHKSH